MSVASPTEGIIGITVNAQELQALGNALQSAGNDFMAEVMDPMTARLNHEGYLSFMLHMHVGDPRIDKHSGRMRAETKEEKISEGVYRTVTYAVSDQGFPYPMVENRREGIKAGYGPHAFIQPALQSVNQLIPELIKEFGNWMRSRISGGGVGVGGLK